MCIEIVKSGKNSQVMVSGTSNKNKLAMQNKVKQMAEKLINL